MSIAYICDITGEIVDYDDSGTRTVADKNTTINGVDVNIKVQIVVDAFNGAKKTNISDNVWPLIIQKVRNYFS